MTNTDNTAKAKQIITNAFKDYGVLVEKLPPAYNAYVIAIKNHLNAGQIDRAHSEADLYALELAAAGWGEEGI